MLQRYEQEVLPTKRGQMQDKSLIKLLMEEFGDFHLASLTSSVVAQFRGKRLKVVGPQTVIHEINMLNRVLKAATLDWGIALPGGLPTANVRKPAKPRGRDRRVTTEEINKSCLLPNRRSGDPSSRWRWKLASAAMNWHLSNGKTWI